MTKCPERRLKSDRPHLTRLGNLLRKLCTWDGPMPFSRFMEFCLYHPQWGYYSTPREKIGADGDYYTSSSLGPAFGRTLARQFALMWEACGRGRFTLVEMGAGRGVLARDVITALAKERPEFLADLRYHIVEVSDAMAAVQAKTLAPLDLPAGTVRRFSDPGELRSVRGCFFSNELVDAFPVHRVEMSGGELLEVHVDYDDDADKFEERLLEPSTPTLAKYLDELGVKLVEGQRADLNLNALAWLTKVNAALDSGFVLTIDYGHEAKELYSTARMAGSLVAYKDHRVSNDVFANIGEQDLTTMVDFTSLRNLAEELGLRQLFYGTQRDYLTRLGILDTFARPGRSDDEMIADLAIKNLVVPGAMGEIFKVHLVAKGVAVEPERVIPSTADPALG
ncbi:MAG: SAM-dependent methyltransferase [Euryarchaeota archaeon]|nr:SAM-dependent methyltransferase [Euryarchaeota archaeon]